MIKQKSSHIPYFWRKQIHLQIWELERAGSDCYHTHHFTTITAGNCGFLLKIEHTTPHHSNRKPVALRGAAAAQENCGDWLTETRQAATHGEPGAKAALEFVVKIFLSLGADLSHQVYLYSPTNFDPGPRTSRPKIQYFLPPSLTIYPVVGALCVGNSSSGAADLSHPYPSGGGGGLDWGGIFEKLQREGNVCWTNEDLSALWRNIVIQDGSSSGAWLMSSGQIVWTCVCSQDHKPPDNSNICLNPTHSNQQRGAPSVYWESYSLLAGGWLYYDKETLPLYKWSVSLLSW